MAKLGWRPRSTRRTGPIPVLMSRDRLESEMKSGKTLVELAKEIERRAQSKVDLVVNTQQATVRSDPQGDIKIAFGDHAYPLNDVAHRQIGEHYGIPAKYYDRMRETQSDLLAHNINAWMHSTKENHLIRTMDGRARAFLSDRYRPLENEQLAEVVLPVLSELEVDIVSADITDKNLYIKAVDRRIAMDVPVGHKIGDGSHVFFDTLSPAIVIRNSEVGWGALSVDTSIFTKMCTNLATIDKKGSLRQYHVGGKHDIGEELYGMLSDRTRRLADAALWSKVRDIVKVSFEEVRFRALIEQKITPMTVQTIDGDPVKVVEFTSRKLGISDGERTSVLQHLIRGGDLTRYGLFNAITRTAQDLESYDRATELEALGGKIVELPRNEWEQLAKAA